MRRRTFDVLVSAGGLLLAIVLAVGGGLLWWGYSFANNEVHDQLVAQKIVFPPADSEAITSLPPDDQTQMKKYAGETMSDGAMAKTYADHYIAVHLSEVAGGKTYAEVSTESLAAPNNQTLAAQKETLFQGETLRGLLLNAYAFWQIGQIARIAAIVCWVAALILLVLAVLGFVHLRRTPADAELLPPHSS